MTLTLIEQVHLTKVLGIRGLTQFLYQFYLIQCSSCCQTAESGSQFTGANQRFDVKTSFIRSQNDRNMSSNVSMNFCLHIYSEK